MELVFIYVSKFKNFVDQSFHFDSRYRFSYERGNDNFHRTLRLVSFDEKALPKDFYRLKEFGSGIVDCVSAVVGENGTGKTTLAVLIQDIMEPAGSMKEFAAVFCEENESEGIRFSVYCHVPIDVNTRHHGVSFEGFACEPDVYLWPDYTWPQNCENDLRTKIRLIYYSPLFTTERVFGYRERVYDSEERISEKGYPDVADTRRFGIRDLSVTGTTLNLIDDETFSSGSSSLLIYERKRVVDFMREVSSDPKLEAALDISAVKKDNSLAFCLVDDELNETLHPAEINLPGMEISVKMEIEGLNVDEYFDVVSRHQYLTNPIVRAFYLYANICFREWWLSPKQNKAFRRDIKWLIQVGNSARRRMIKDECAAKVAAFLIASIERYSGGDSRFESFGVFLTRLKLLSETIKADLGCERWYFPLKTINDKTYTLYMDLMIAYFEARRRRDICSFGFKWSLSSGEMSYISMWARIFGALKGMRNGSARHDSAILFMDEAETALHPKWQRQLVFRMIATWTRLMPEGKHLQLIFGSHSPMLLSDIPKGNVVFLGSEGEVRAMDGIANTFGANIFDLFKSSFFLDEGPIGEFARRKINSLLGRLSKDGAVINRDSDDEILARLVGDSYIRSYLMTCID